MKYKLTFRNGKEKIYRNSHKAFYAWMDADGCTLETVESDTFKKDVFAAFCAGTIFGMFVMLCLVIIYG